MGNKFDKNIKEKIEGLHINYDDAAWDSFEKKLDDTIVQEDIEDAVFDQQIKDKLQDKLSFDFEEEHWQELSTRIDHDNELANRIYLFKIIELVVLVLLAYSFFQIEPIKNPTKNLPLYAHSELFKSIDADKILAQSISNNSIAQDNFASAIALRTVILDMKVKKEILLSFDKAIAIVKPVITDLRIAPLTSNTLVPAIETSTKLDRDDVDYDFANIAMAEQSLQRDLLAINTLDKDEKNIIVPPPVVQKGSENWLTLSTSSDINLVNTPAEYILNRRDNLLGVAGISGAITYGSKSGNNEFEIGLGYSYKNYDPDLRKQDIYSIENDGSSKPSQYRTSLNRISFHIAQVPINYKRYFVDNHKWSAFMTVGFTPNFILYSDYDLTDELLSGIASPKTYRKKNIDLLKRTYYTGLLQNIETETAVKKRSSAPSPDEFRTEGNIFDNTFITSITGLGIQRNLGKNRSIFLQASYHHQFFGDKLGPNSDQINTFSFTLGSKYKI